MRKITKSNIEHSEFKKLYHCVLHLLCVLVQNIGGKGRQDLKSILTFIYRQYLFSYQGNIEKRAITEILGNLNYEFEYLVYNHYSNNDFDKKSSCLGFEESCHLSSLIRYSKPQKILEFGSNKGGTTYNLYLNSSPNCEITTVDKNKIDMSDPNAEKCLSDERVKIITIDTKFLDSKLEGQNFDFIFIDAGHSYHEIKNDTEIALKHLGPKGIIVWHDYCRLEPEVIRYLEELSFSLSLVHIKGGTLVVYFN